MNAKDLTWLAINAYHEARGEIFDGQVAVCHVVLNRVIRRKKTLKEIVLEPKQFSWTINGNPPVRDYAAFERCMQAAMVSEQDRISHGDTLDGADHYYAFKGPNAIKEPSWVKAGKMREVARIGNHVFFRS